MATPSSFAEQLAEAARSMQGWSSTQLTLEEVVRVRKIQSLPKFFGSGIWEGDLSEMREDRKPRGRRSK